MSRLDLVVGPDSAGKVERLDNQRRRPGWLRMPLPTPHHRSYAVPCLILAGNGQKGDLTAC